MPSEISTINGDQSVEMLRRELAEAREQHAATAEILASISSSVTEADQVFAKIAASAARLCDAYDATIYQVDADVLRLVAHHGPIQVGPVGQVGQFTLPLIRGLLNARAVLDCQVIQVADLQAEGDEYPAGKDFATRFGFRTLLAVPLLRTGHAIGVISIRRAEIRPFTDRQVDLLKTFADQAVIAIENTRLFEAEQTRTAELQARTRELTESLEQQTATADVLKVISRSALDVQKVLDALVESAARPCNAHDAAIFQVFGDGLRLVAHHGQIPMSRPVGQLTFPLVRGRIGGCAVIDRRTIHVADMLAEADEYPESRQRALQLGVRTVLAVPLVHAGKAIGVIAIRRAEVRPFTERQIELVNTFADQAVIAIENTRLFEEVQARTRELTESLEQQTATSEVLGVISSSPGELEPVFQTMLENAVRICDAQFGTLFRYDGKLLYPAAGVGTPPALAEFLKERGPFLPPPTSRLHDMLQTRKVQHVVDGAANAVPSVSVKFGGARSLVDVPMLKDDEVVGAITIYRQEVRPFTDKQIELVKNFANQAVIAIENTRLL